MDLANTLAQLPQPIQVQAVQTQSQEIKITPQDLKILVRNEVTKRIIESKPRTIIKEGKAPEAPKEATALTKNNIKRTLNDAVDLVRTIDGVHLDLFDYFDISPSLAQPGDMKRLQYISQWVANHSMIKLNSLDNRLGNNDGKQAKLIKIYNWIKLRNGNS